MKFISIKADINDCDYVTKISSITDNEIVRIKEILNKMPKSRNKIRYNTGEAGNDDQENSNYNHISYDEKQLLGRFLPYGDENYPGIHTIVEVKIFEQLEVLL